MKEIGFEAFYPDYKTGRKGSGKHYHNNKTSSEYPLIFFKTRDCEFLGGEYIGSTTKETQQFDRVPYLFKIRSKLTQRVYFIINVHLSTNEKRERESSMRLKIFVTNQSTRDTNISAKKEYGSVKTILADHFSLNDKCEPTNQSLKKSKEFGVSIKLFPNHIYHLLVPKPYDHIFIPCTTTKIVSVINITDFIFTTFD
ncbi:hypothetical protein PPL_11336 [Heterostelium album PN500]|uniref:Uncharacterized protein n=1 Tax=Heterostelium pallidum (strain ATCC 26659 / Pp 5 / PN500) TaxID=670386 RepID=D3BT44_HETP5|nr:hypothetical protein PPL_11336 [Heterostelium album PN500]EFA75261.1 hypothetical protein PPL_11336 [Heterostelium album PN500]|eukprot:XP_020427395.1 hypothetical protein PPL_11336 [Heterostelium album PN500]